MEQFILSERQLEIIQSAKDAFGSDLRVSWLLDFDADTGEWLQSGSVFLYVRNITQDRLYDYPTSLGHFENPGPVLEAVREVVYG